MLPAATGAALEMSQPRRAGRHSRTGELKLETRPEEDLPPRSGRQAAHRNVRRIGAAETAARGRFRLATWSWGYTNGGKSTLFQIALTKAKGVASSSLFASSIRPFEALTYPQNQSSFSDTVGFIRHLPHTCFRRSAPAREVTARDHDHAGLGCHAVGFCRAGCARESVLKELEVTKSRDEK